MSVIDLGAILERVEASAPVDSVKVVATLLADMVGADAVTFLIADFSGRSVVRLTSAGRVTGARSAGTEQAETLPLTGTPYEQVLRTQQISVEQHGDGVRLIAPVTDRGDAIGLLEMTFAAHPDDGMVREVGSAAHALAYVVIAARQFTDLFEWGFRSTPFELAAEIQRRLLPLSYTCEASQFTLAGWLEPAAQVGGDTFDYTLDRSRLHVSITDAVGHQVDAALLATLLVGGLRNGRRRGLDLAEQARYANDAMAAHAAHGQFVTGQLLRVDLERGTAEVVNAGHPLPIRLRGGRVEEIGLAVDAPFGVIPGRTFQVQPLALEPGDRIVLLTDGMQERNAVNLDVAAALADTAAEHPREVVHALGAAVLGETRGDLRDDATVVCLDWIGGPARERATELGSDPSQVSDAR